MELRMRTCFVDSGMLLSLFLGLLGHFRMGDRSPSSAWKSGQATLSQSWSLREASTRWPSHTSLKAWLLASHTSWDSRIFDFTQGRAFCFIGGWLTHFRLDALAFTVSLKPT